MWQGMVKARKILKYPESTAMHGDYFETMFDMSCFIWFQLYSESQRTECINNLIDYIIRVCKLKFTSTVSCIINHFKTCYILCIFSVAVV